MIIGMKEDRGLATEKTSVLLKPGRYALCVSVGTRQGTPKIALPLAGQIGTTRRYEIGKVTVE